MTRISFDFPADMQTADGEAQKNNLPAGLAKPAQRALAAAGIQRLDQVTAMSENQLRQLHGIGSKAVDTLRAALQAQGMAFAAAEERGGRSG